ncbi:MAG: hypothetical protein IJX02_06700 [Clostridia bacterium]|nr:hypothetical protein [Clostridia bacterium]
MVYNRELTHKELIDELIELDKENEAMNLTYIGSSVFDRAIPLVTLGDKSAKKAVLYVATHHACESLCTVALLKFIKDYLRLYENLAQVYQINVRYLYRMRKVYIVPLLNPDGLEYRLSGVERSNPIRDRIIAYNGGEDFSTWSANGRGVDLNHNYDAYFEEYKEIEKREGIFNGKTGFSGEYAESEPESAALANFIRYNIDEIEGVISLHSQGEEIYYQSKGYTPRAGEHIGKIISKLTGYRLSSCDGKSAMGGLTDWFIKEFDKPSFTVECGRGENPLPPSQISSIYTRLREMLFTFPILF